MTEPIKNTDKNITILNWMDDDMSMEVTAGIKFDPTILYTLELTKIDRIREQKEDKVNDYLDLFWTEQESSVVIKQRHFIHPKTTLNADAPEKSGSLVLLAKRLGYNVNVGDKAFHPKNFLRVGMKIQCNIVDQINYKTKLATGFSEISIATIVPAGKKAQQTIASNPDDVKKWQAEVTAGKFAKQELYVQMLASTGRLTEVAPFMDAAKAGQITFQ